MKYTGPEVAETEQVSPSQKERTWTRFYRVSSDERREEDTGSGKQRN